jgi:RNA polymerase sigma factor (sigma-70 family)
MSDSLRLDPELDARLAERCLAGDPHAWTALVRRHERLVYAVARSYRLSDPDLADVFQDVFTALAKGLPRLRDARTLVRWLSSTTERIALATTQRRRREDAMTTDTQGDLTSLRSGDAPVGADLELLEQQAMVRLALGALAPRCQRLLAALYYEEPAPSYGDLATRLGVPIGSLGPTRARCLEKLREALERPVAEPGRISATATSTSPGRTGAARGRVARSREDESA